jgi:hypothetical protein
LENFEPIQYDNENKNVFSLKYSDVINQAIDLFKNNLTSFLLMWICFQLPLLLFGNFFINQNFQFGQTVPPTQIFNFNFFIYLMLTLILSFFYFSNFTSLIHNIYYQENNSIVDAIKRASTNYSNQFVTGIKLFFFLMLLSIAFVILIVIVSILSAAFGGAVGSVAMMGILTLVLVIPILFLTFLVAYVFYISGIYCIKSKDIFDLVKILLKPVKWKAFWFFIIPYIAVMIISTLIQFIIQTQGNLLVLKIISNFILFPFSTFLMISQSTYIINLYELYKEANPEPGIIPDVLSDKL